MRSHVNAVLVVAAASCLAACHGDTAPATSAGAPASAQPAAQESADASARYDCQAGTAVLVLGDGNARAELPGGERYDLSRVAGSDPAVYAGNSLYFTVGAGSAHLSQQDGSRELACTRHGAPPG